MYIRSTLNLCSYVNVCHLSKQLMILTVKLDKNSIWFLFNTLRKSFKIKIPSNMPNIPLLCRQNTNNPLDLIHNDALFNTAEQQVCNCKAWFFFVHSLSIACNTNNGYSVQKFKTNSNKKVMDRQKVAVGKHVPWPNRK